MLLKVMSDSIQQRCDACGAERALEHTSLQVGFVHGDPPVPMDPNVIALPSCTDCGASEFLNRVAATDPDEVTDTADHRRGVNALHAALVAAGRAAPGLSEWFASESIDTDKGETPWSFAGIPAAVSGAPDAAVVAFAQYAASREEGGS